MAAKVSFRGASLHDGDSNAWKKLSKPTAPGQGGRREKEGTTKAMTKRDENARISTLPFISEKEGKTGRYHCAGGSENWS